MFHNSYIQPALVWHLCRRILCWLQKRKRFPRILWCVYFVVSLSTYIIIDYVLGAGHASHAYALKAEKSCSKQNVRVLNVNTGHAKITPNIIKRWVTFSLAKRKKKANWKNMLSDIFEANFTNLFLLFFFPFYSSEPMWSALFCSRYTPIRPYSS